MGMRGGLAREVNLCRGQDGGLVDEVAEGALQAHGFGGEGAGGRAEKLKLGKQRAEIARRRARRSTAVSCPSQFPVPRALLSSLCGFPSLVSAFSLSAFQLFASWPVEQRALGLPLGEGDFNQTPTKWGRPFDALDISALLHKSLRSYDYNHLSHARALSPASPLPESVETRRAGRRTAWAVP